MICWCLPAVRKGIYALLACGLIGAAAAQAQNFGTLNARCVLKPLKDSALSSIGRERVAERLVSLGDVVEAGDILVRFFSGGLGAKLERAKAELDLAQSKWERAKRLQRVVTAAEQEQALADYLTRKADVSEIEMEAVKFELRAPHRGIVIETPVDVGEIVDDGPAVRLVQIDRIRAEFDLPVEVIGTHAVGDIIEIENEARQRRQGKVVFVDPLVELASRTFRLHAEVGNDDNKWVVGTSCNLAGTGG